MKGDGRSSCKGYRERERERNKRGGETVSAAQGWSLLVLILAPPVILES